MRLRQVVPLTALPLLAATVLFAQEGPSALRQLWLSGNFEAVRSYVSTHQQAGETSSAFLSEAALAMEQSGEYKAASELYAQYAQSLIAQPDEILQARTASWRCAARAGLDWQAAAGRDVQQRLANTARQNGRERQLALELDCAMRELSTGELKPAAELRTKYPNSSITLRDARQRVDRITREGDDAKRIASIRQFLADYPGSYWRHTAYRLWMYSCWRQQAWEGLRSAASSYLKEFPQSPEANGAISRYFFEAGIEAEKGMAYAKAGVDLYEKKLGITPGPSSLNEINSRTAGRAQQHDYLPPNGRRIFLDYLGSRYNLARYLARSGKAAESLALVQPVIALDPFTNSEAQTTAPFHFMAAQCYEAQKKKDEAYRSYLFAASITDPQPRFSLQAEARLQELARSLPTETTAQIAAEVLQQLSPSARVPRFSDVSDAAGLGSDSCRRCAWADVDGDHDPDLLLDGSRLLINSGAAGFKDQSRPWGMSSGRTGAAMADFDNDGDSDAYIYGAGKGGDRLLRNEGTRFIDVTVVSGDCDDGGPTAAAAWLDADNDGWLDLMTVSYNPRQGASGSAIHCFRNTGRGVMAASQDSLAALPAEILRSAECSGLCISDVNADALPDVYVTRMHGLENLLLLNAGGGAYVNAARQLACAGSWTDGAWGNSIAADFADLNADGSADIFCCNVQNADDLYHSPSSQFYLARPAGSSELGFSSPAALPLRADAMVSEPVVADFNNDGRLDLFLAVSGNAGQSSLYLASASGWSEAAYASGARVRGALGGAWADYDSDGDADLLLCTPDGPKLLRNDSAPLNWLEVVCTGGSSADGEQPSGLSSASALGTRLILESGPLTMLREIQCSKGGGCGNQQIAHFGLGDKAGLCTLTVEFPSGRKVKHSIKAARQRIYVSEIAGVQFEAAPAAVPAAAPVIKQTSPVQPEAPISRPGATDR